MAQGVKRETGQQLRELQVDHGAAMRQLAAVQEASERAQARLQVPSPLTGTPTSFYCCGSIPFLWALVTRSFALLSCSFGQKPLLWINCNAGGGWRCPRSQGGGGSKGGSFRGTAIFSAAGGEFTTL